MKDIHSSSPAIIAELAIRLHEEHSSELRLDFLPDQALADIDLPVGCKVVAGAIEFESFEVRNVIVAAAVYDRIRYSSDVNADMLFKEAYRLWRHEIGRSDQASGRLLALASERLDIFAVGAQRIRSGSNVFDVLHLIEAALPYLSSLEASSIIDLMTAKYEPTKNDMMAGVINGALEKWLEKRPTLADELHEKVLGNLSDSTSSLLGNAIIALSKSDYIAAVKMAKTDALSDTLMRAQIGIWTLGRLLLEEHAKPEIIDIVVESVKELISSDQRDIRSQAIRAAVGAMHKMEVFDELLQGLAKDNNQDVLCAVAAALFHKNKEIRDRGLTQSWLQLMPTLKPEFGGAIRDLDYAMSQLLSVSGFATIVVATLTQWVANHGRQVALDSSVAELFDDTIRNLLPMEENWALLVTDWLLSDGKEHAVALSGILAKLSTNETTKMKFDKSRLDALTASDLMFLARRMLGYVHDRMQVTSLALSMLQTTDLEKRIYPLLRALLVDEIGYDYPKSTADALREAAEEISAGSKQDFLRTMAEAIDSAIEAQRSLPFISELRPSTKVRRLFIRARAKQMDRSFEKANKNSIWRQIATHIPIKAGMGTFSYRDSNYGPPVKLSSMSHSIELPRREVFDPIGNSIRHLGFKLAERDEP